MVALSAAESGDIETVMAELGVAARAAAHTIAHASAETKTSALRAAAAAIRERATDILEANSRDMEAAKQRELTAALLERLELDGDRIEAMAAGLETIATLADPVGRELDSWDRPNGLAISRVSVPIGVIGIIFESRPNVTADAAALAIKAGNAAILRAGSESYHSSRAIMACLQQGLAAANLPSACAELIPVTDRAAVGILLRMDDCVDLIVPRGGKGLIQRVKAESRIPIFAHLDGICHVYVHEAADPEMARDVLFNAKMRRTGICGAAETLLIDRSIAVNHLVAVLDPLVEAGCELRGDAVARGVDSRLGAAREEDWETEYLDAILSVRIVDGIEAAIDHINRHGSHHTDTIVTADDVAAAYFLDEIDSGIVMHNCSTQFADGGEFGMGAEIGISTGKLHARGPVGAEQLTTYKYRVQGTGQVRP